jgi:hypothetical protein
MLGMGEVAVPLVALVRGGHDPLVSRSELDVLATKTLLNLDRLKHVAICRLGAQMHGLNVAKPNCGEVVDLGFTLIWELTESQGGRVTLATVQNHLNAGFGLGFVILRSRDRDDSGVFARREGDSIVEMTTIVHSHILIERLGLQPLVGWAEAHVAVNHGVCLHINVGEQPRVLGDCIEHHFLDVPDLCGHDLCCCDRAWLAVANAELGRVRTLVAIYCGVRESLGSGCGTITCSD